MTQYGTGIQTPTYRTVPSRTSIKPGKDAVQLASVAGLNLDPWQRDTIIDAMALNGNKWAATEVGLVVPRQNGKGSILEAVVLYWLEFYLDLVDLPNALLIWSAHEHKTSREAFLRVKTLIENSPHIMKRVKTIRIGNGEESVEFKNGTRLRFIARSKVAARGFSGDLIILDEAFALNDAQLASLFPTLSARPNPQVWYTSSAPTASAEVLRKLCKQGRKQAGDLAYFEWCAPRGSRHDDREAWRRANPGLGIRLSYEFTEKELGRLDPEDFERERLGIWLEEAAETVIDMDIWNSLKLKKQEDSTGKTVALAIDVTPDRKFGSIAAASRRNDGSILVEIIDNLPGTKWMVPRLVDLMSTHNPCVVMVDSGSPAASLLGDLEDQGFKVSTDPEPEQAEIIVKTGSQGLAQACGAFYDGVTDHANIWHMGDTVMKAALEGAAQRPLGESWAWSRKQSENNVAPLVAASLAVQGLKLYGKDEEPEVFVF